MSDNRTYEAKVLESGLPSNTKLILLVIGALTNANGECEETTYNELARYSSLGTHVVVSEVEHAIELGWLKRGVIL
jgi:hypothetical protein